MGELTAGAAQDDEHGVTRADLDRLSMSSNPFLEKSLEFLGECMDDLAAEQQKVALPAQPLSAAAAAGAVAAEAKAGERGASRGGSGAPAGGGGEPGPEAGRRAESPEGFLIANQVNQYVDQVQEFGHASLQKLYLVSGAQGVDTVAPVTPAAEA